VLKIEDIIKDGKYSFDFLSKYGILISPFPILFGNHYVVNYFLIIPSKLSVLLMRSDIWNLHSILIIALFPFFGIIEIYVTRIFHWRYEKNGEQRIEKQKSKEEDVEGQCLIRRRYTSKIKRIRSVRV